MATTKKKAKRPATVAAEQYDAALQRIDRLEREQAQLLTRYHRVVDKLASLAAIAAGERVRSASKEIKQRGGPSDEQLVTEREKEAANAIIQRRIKQREREDKAFIDKAVEEMIAQGVSRADAQREARRLRDATRTTTEEEAG